MASFAGRRRAAPPWSVDDASTFAALKEFKLLQLLSTDKQALATARRLGLSFSHSQSQPTSRSPAGSGAAPPRPPVADAAPVSMTKNARQRRSAERSARRHAARRAQLCTRSMLSLLFIVRLRRMVDGTLGIDHEVSSVLAKRRPDERPPSSSSSSRSASSSSTPAWLVSRLSEGVYPPVQHGQGRQEKRSRSLACWQVSCCASPAAGRLVCAHRDVSQGYTSPLLHRCVGMSARACLLALAPASTEVRGTTLLQCGSGAWAGYDVSSGPRQYFGDDYLTSLA